MIKTEELLAFAQRINNSKSSVAIDDGGLTLVEIDEHGKETGVYLEVGGIRRPINWVLFTKQTREPKLSWLERALDAGAIEHKRAEESYGMANLLVPAYELHAANEILSQVDTLRDDDPAFI